MCRGKKSPWVIHSRFNSRVLSAAPSESRACLSRLPEQHRAKHSGEEPEQDVGQQAPHGALHADDALVALGVLADEHPAEDAKRSQVQDQQHGVDAERDGPRLEPGEREHDGREGRQRAHDRRVHPLGVVVDARFARVVQVRRVQPDDDEAHDELEEPQREEEGAGQGERGGEAVLKADFLALHGAAIEEFEGHGGEVF